jgi:hypothetical protein
MKRSTMLMLTAAVMGLALGGGVLRAAGQQFRETVIVKGTVRPLGADHRLTFSAPIALPGVSLGAGTYIFRRPAANVLQVMGVNGTPYAMVNTASVMRTSTDGYAIVLGDRAAPGAPRRIEAWFAPGEATGQQLIYSAR